MARSMMTAEQAYDILFMCDIPRNAPPDFHALTSDRVATLLHEADEYEYRAPKNANGSRARYFYAYVCRRLSAKG